MDRLRNTFTPYVRGILPEVYDTPHSQIHTYNRIAPPSYSTPLLNVQYVTTNRPRYELVVFTDCFANDRCALWKQSKQSKQNQDGHGCAINSLRFLNAISEPQQMDLIDQLEYPGTFFEETIEFVKDLISGKTPTPRIVEKQYSVKTFNEIVALFKSLEQWMPANSCTIFRANYLNSDGMGHTAIIAKGDDNKLYIVDPLLNRIVLHNSEKFYTNNIDIIDSISLMFAINTAPRGGRGSQHRRRRRRTHHPTHKRTHKG